jgi:meiotic recombination protein SPO11
MMHEALVEKTIVTKRDIYYKDTQLFGSQSVVDRVSPALLKSGSTRN